MTTPEPRANPDFLGHAAAEAAFLHAWRSGRLPHAWLITGPHGVGKATLAYRFARFALSGGRGSASDLAMDPRSPVFRRVASGSHADLLSVERGFDEKRGRLRSEIVVNDVRDVGSFLHLTPAEGGWRVVVIDSADEMNPNAANALLKILEEPPRQALLLLVSHAPGGLLPTIRSRCRRLSLRPLNEAALRALLERHDPDLSDEDVAVLVRLAEGSPGRALHLAAEGGIELYRDVTELMLSLPKLDGARLHGLGDRLARSGGETAFRTATELLVWWFGRMIRAGASGVPPTEVLPGEAECMRRLLQRRSLDRWLELWEKMARLFAETESANLDRKQVWIGAFLDIEGLARP